MSPPLIFVSYARTDRQVVAPIVELLRASLHGLGLTENPTTRWELVFRDEDSLEPGQAWRDGIDRAIRSSEKVFVFWCCHAAKSEELQREVQLAISCGKAVIPILLDDTKLMPQLAPIQAVDLTALLLHGFDGLRAGGPEKQILRAFAPTLESSFEHLWRGYREYIKSGGWLA